MKIRVLGCSGSIAATSRTTAFLLDQDLLIDAGTGVGDLTLEELSAVDHILLSHSHLDHVLGIALLADSVMRRRAQAGRPPIRVHGLPGTLDALRQHIFNGVIWPDFSRLPSVERPVLEFSPLAVGQVLEFDAPAGSGPGTAARRIEVLSAVHTVPAVGYAVATPRGHFVYTGDTGPNPALWARLREIPVSQLVIETAFSDDERELADISRHLCPSLLGRELAYLNNSVDVLITHIKPGDTAAVLRQIAALALPHRVRALATGETLELG